MTALTWREAPHRPGGSCQANCGKRGSIRNEPMIAGYPIKPDRILEPRFLICRDCREEWTRIWANETGGNNP